MRRIGRADHRHERQLRRRQREAPLPRLVPPGEQLLRPQIVPTHHCRDYHPRHQALGQDPRLRLSAPPPPTQCPGDHLEPLNLTDLRVKPYGQKLT